MTMKIVMVALGAGLLGSLTWGAIGLYNNQVHQTNIAILTTTITQRDAIIQQANQDYATLSSQYDELGEYYKQVQDNYAQSQTEVGNLRGEVVNLEANVSQLQGEVADLEEVSEVLGLEIDNLESKYDRDIAYYKKEVEEAEFSFYYVPASQRYGVDDLEEYIQRWKWAESAYVLNKFDCSQMSAYLEWKFENEGYHTVIVTGDSPDGSGYHAWLLVELEEGKYMPVEATAYSIVYWSSPYFDKYYEYEYEFETIHDVSFIYDEAEFKWW